MDNTDRRTREERRVVTHALAPAQNSLANRVYERQVSKQNQMLIRESVSGYMHFDLGNIKLAFTQVCWEEVFKNV